VHGDAAGVGALTDALRGWLTDMRLIAAQDAILGRYIGYYEPYATSHEELDDDEALFEETKGAARGLLATVRAVRSGEHPALERGPEPRPK
jgi:hypothetical protein